MADVKGLKSSHTIPTDTDLLRKYLDTSVPEYKQNTHLIDTEKNYPRFNALVEKLKPVVDATKKENYPFDVREGNDSSIIPRSEVHPLHKLLKQAGASTETLKDSVQASNDYSERTTRDYEDAMYKILLQATNPVHLQNMKYSRDIGKKQKFDLLDDLSDRNSIIANEITGAGRTKFAVPANGIMVGSNKRSYNGIYNPDTQDVVVNLPDIDSAEATTVHETLHAKDYGRDYRRQGAPENLNGEEFREQYGNLDPNSFWAVNQGHLDESFELEDPKKRRLEPAEIGTAAALYNKINKLLKDK